MDKDEIKIYEMKLHDIREYSCAYTGGTVMIVRVAGGWVYQTCGFGNSVSAAFVPFNNEFLVQKER